MSDVNRAIIMAVEAHRGQRDEKGLPYIYHPLHVMNSMPLGDMEGRIVAVLHDVIEDTECSEFILGAAGFALGIVDAVLAISKEDGEGYEAYLVRVKGNAIARRVKLKDAGHNHERSVDELIHAVLKDDDAACDKAEKRIKKYRKAIDYLEAL